MPILRIAIREVTSDITIIKKNVQADCLNISKTSSSSYKIDETFSSLLGFNRLVGNPFMSRGSQIENSSADTKRY